MGSQDLNVRNVRGRYGRGVLRSRNILATVQEVARVYRIRLDDAANPDAWLEITLEVDTPHGEPEPSQTPVQAAAT